MIYLSISVITVQLKIIDGLRKWLSSYQISREDELLTENRKSTGGGNPFQHICVIQNLLNKPTVPGEEDSIFNWKAIMLEEIMIQKIVEENFNTETELNNIPNMGEFRWSTEEEIPSLRKLRESWKRKGREMNKWLRLRNWGIVHGGRVPPFPASTFLVFYLSLE
ncbi:hypothetical protein SDJN03_19270, partial [Cucurbita argyrosperma subsp. sororia]